MDVAIINQQTGLIVSVVEIEDMTEFEVGEGLLAVDATDQPATSGGSWSEEGGFVLPFVPIDVDQTRAIKAALVNGKRDALIAAGFRYDFGEDLGVRVLDQRGAADEIAWLTVERKASKAVADGYGEVPFPLRDAANETFVTTAAAAAAAMDGMADWRIAISLRSWELKDQILAADEAELQDIDVESGWPE